MPSLLLLKARDGPVVCTGIPTISIEDILSVDKAYCDDVAAMITTAATEWASKGGRTADTVTVACVQYVLVIDETSGGGECAAGAAVINDMLEAYAYN